MYRCVLGAELYREGDPCLVVVTGGIVTPYDATPVAEAMAEFLVKLGIERDHIMIENESRSTPRGKIFLLIELPLRRDQILPFTQYQAIPNHS